MLKKGKGGTKSEETRLRWGGLKANAETLRQCKV